jgi:hypothetical protein
MAIKCQSLYMFVCGLRCLVTFLLLTFCISSRERSCFSLINLRTLPKHGPARDSTILKTPLLVRHGGHAISVPKSECKIHIGTRLSSAFAKRSPGRTRNDASQITRDCERLLRRRQYDALRNSSTY